METFAGASNYSILVVDADKTEQTIVDTETKAVAVPIARAHTGIIAHKELDLPVSDVVALRAQEDQTDQKGEYNDEHTDEQDDEEVMLAFFAAAEAEDDRGDVFRQRAHFAHAGQKRKRASTSHASDPGEVCTDIRNAETKEDDTYEDQDEDGFEDPEHDMHEFFQAIGSHLDSLDERAATIAAARAVVPTKLDFQATASIPPLKQHDAFFVPGAQRGIPQDPQTPSDLDVDVKPNPLPRSERLTQQEFYDTFVCATDEQCLDERGAAQGSEPWLKARSMPITGSQFGAAIGECPYPDSTPYNVVHDKIHNTFRGNVATRWGNAHEDHAQEAFETWFPIWLRQRFVDAGRSAEETDAALAKTEFLHDNLIRFSKTPWMGVSPDGLVRYEDADGSMKLALIEHKCPYTARGNDTQDHPYAKWDDPRFAKNVPKYYG